MLVSFWQRPRLPLLTTHCMLCSWTVGTTMMAPSGSETVMSVVTFLSTRGVEGMCVEWSEPNSIASFPGFFLLVSGMSLPFQCMITNYMYRGAL